MRTACGELSALSMMKLTHSAAEGLPSLDRSPAELALLRSLMAPLILLVTDPAQPAPHMLACALWGMARIPALVEPLVEAGAVVALVAVADRLLNEAKATADRRSNMGLQPRCIGVQPQHIWLRPQHIWLQPQHVWLQATAKELAAAARDVVVEVVAAADEACKKAVAAGLRPDEVAKAIAEAEEEAEAAVLAAATDAAADAAGAAEYGGSVTGMLLEWSIAALWTLCTPPPEQARPPMHPTCDPMQLE